jgi:hypothetical protein
LEIKEQLKESFEHSKALLDAMKFVYQNDQQNIWRFASFKTYMRKYNMIVANVGQITNLNGLMDLFDIDKIPGSMDTIAIQQKEFFDMIYANLSLLISFLGNRLDLKLSEIQNLKNFFQSNLRKAVLHEPQKESDVQDTVEQLLIGKGLTKGIDYDRETGRVRVSIKEVIPDFILLKLDLALEIKFTKNVAKTKTIVDEINADIQSYSKKYGNLLFIVYDFGTIRDEDEFKNDIDNKDNILVSVIKH